MFSEINKNDRYGYITVSSQSEESHSWIKSQKQELMKKGIEKENIWVEIGLAANLIKNRPIFEDLIQNQVKENSLILVTKIDQCSRNSFNFLKLQEKLSKKSVLLIALDMPYSLDFEINKVITKNFAALAKFDSEQRKENQKEGQSKGRKSVITEKLIKQVKHLKKTERLPITKIAKITGKSRNTIYKILKNALGYATNSFCKKEEEKKKDLKRGKK